MLKFISLKAEAISSIGNDDRQVDSAEKETSWRQRMDQVFKPTVKKSSDHDIPAILAREEEVATFYSDRSGATWRERLDIMWSLDEFGMPHPELAFVKQATELSLFCGVCYGAYHESAKVQRIFHEQNKYTMFQHPREAQRALQERIVLAMIQGGWRSGWRMGLLTFTFTSVSQSLVVIRNYINPLDFAVGGAAMGAVYKFNMGPKGMFGAGIAGSLLGLQAGILFWGIQKFSGETVAEKWSREFDVIQEKNQQEKEKEKEDYRNEIIRNEEGKHDSEFNSGVITKEEDWYRNKEEDDWVRKITIKVSGWMEDIGLLNRHSEDSFRISDDVKEPVINTEVAKIDIKNTSDALRTQSEGGNVEV